MSGGKDKTVRIWSLTECAYSSIQPSYVYTHHKKSVAFVGLIEADNRAVSCDGGVHIWDPFTGKQVHKAFVLHRSLLLSALFGAEPSWP